MPDAIAILEDDHRKVEKLFDEYKAAKDTSVMQQICMELKVHSAIEEQVIYPLLATQVEDGGELEGHAEEEHQKIEQMIFQIEKSAYDDPSAEGLMLQIIDGVTHHVKEEESEIFPKLRKTFDSSRLKELGAELEVAKLEERRALKAM